MCQGKNSTATPGNDFHPVRSQIPTDMHRWESAPKCLLHCLKQPHLAKEARSRLPPDGNLYKIQSHFPCSLCYKGIRNGGSSKTRAGQTISASVEEEWRFVCSFLLCVKFISLCSLLQIIRNCYHLHKHWLMCLLEHRVFALVLADFIITKEDKDKKKK